MSGEARQALITIDDRSIKASTSPAGVRTWREDDQVLESAQVDGRTAEGLDSAFVVRQALRGRP